MLLNECKKLEFHKPDFEEASELSKIYALRDNKTCDSTVLDTYIWKELYNTRICKLEDAAFILMQDEKGYFAAMPYCKEEDLPKAFELLKSFFHEELKSPLRIDLADEDALKVLGFDDFASNGEYVIEEESDLKDYLYDAESLRTLAGKKYQKKRNLVNKFMKEYEGRWEYKTMCCTDEYFLEEFMKKWIDVKLSEGVESKDTLLIEKDGIIDILRNCDKVTYRVGGIFIDEMLEAFTIGSYNSREKMAVISIEKGNPDIPGIYQVINQQFLQNSYEEAEIVNREDDMGIEGLRHAKESYNPIGFARKYRMYEKKL
ncbi:MAG: phosphatidylglycerol lysyltransferase domain-containing protein [Butyrivibrio sp.]|nr:phosphatidylglycerol lysyltransferase domain-containing protein [Butyrivibrio sp.]